MARLIGVDTGGTYTDAVVFSEAEGVLAKAKALTTRHDLSIGIGEAIGAAMQAAGIAPADVAMVSMSTTLATNAIVEGLGDHVGLVLVGFKPADLERAGLRDALRGDPVLVLAGGHDAHGSEVLPLDSSPLLPWLAGEAAGVGAFAVASQFSVAHPGHELAVRAAIAERTGKPAVCSHELSARLNAPKRALTALLNARLIGTIHHLIEATERLLHARSITAPVMVVKGDGSLISAEEARRKPIETILSGPAASLVGASYLTGLRDALVSDIGGTTTDVALLRDGRPRLDEQGARVGGWSTMVEAVAMHTIGLGGDSEVGQDFAQSGAALRLGPRRAVPVSLLAVQFPQEVHRALDRQAAMPLPSEQAGRFAVASSRAGMDAQGATGPEADMLRRIVRGPVALTELLGNRRDNSTLERLLTRGAALVSAFTPSDAAHVVGIHTAWDGDAALKAAGLFARRRTRLGENLADGPDAISRSVIAAVTRASAESLLDACFAEEGDLPTGLSTHPLVQSALRRRPSLVRLAVDLSVPIVALGAAAATYYPDVAAQLNTRAVIPDHADVANAIGAVVGHVRVTSTVTISRPSDEHYRLHLEEGPRDFIELAEAVAVAEECLRETVTGRAAANGAPRVEIHFQHERQAVPVGGGELFLQMTVSATATGRPALAW